MKKKILTALAFAIALICLFGTVSVFAFEPYDTYTYDIDGNTMLSPTAFNPGEPATSKTMGLLQNYGNQALKFSSDICTDYAGNIYITDTNNHRFVFLDRFYHATGTLSSYVDEYGNTQTFNYPAGAFVTNETLNADGSRYLYVCDTGNRRIVVFDVFDNYSYVRTITRPVTALLDETTFVPEKVAVDQYGRIFVTSSSCVDGVIVLSSDGEFTGFIGGNKVTGSVWERFWRRFQSKEKRDATITIASTPVSYNNIIVDDEGFIFVTASYTTSESQKEQQKNIKDKSASKSTVKKLNSAGAEIMKRNGFFDPGGEVAMGAGTSVSTIVDVAIGPEQTWTILDSKHCRFFTYDNDGNLLFAFGDTGDQVGTGQETNGTTATYRSLCYQRVVDSEGVESYNILLLELSQGEYMVTPFIPDDYYNSVLTALRAQNEFRYSESIELWQDVLKKNNNFDLAYIGIGKALYSQGKYTEAMEMLEKSYETTYWALAKNKDSSAKAGKFLILIVLAAIAVIVVIAKFLSFAKKKNKAVSLKVGRKTYGEELLYVFHLIFHPFDGFWDLKHEKRGSVRAATTIMALTAVALFYQSIGRSYSANPRGEFSTITSNLIGVVILVLLWSVANWCLTTLFDGEGSFKDVYVATCYAISPMIFFYIVSTLTTHIMTDATIPNLIISIGYVWCGFLLFFGMLTTHDYSIGKNLLITVCTLVAMIVIMFGVLLFGSLCGKMIDFVVSLVEDIGDRV
ncbi:MAG: YIP1 family protein [Clostridia bacterium]|nr:YIP1 family protein [Clostridia bacterium]